MAVSVRRTVRSRPSGFRPGHEVSVEMPVHTDAVTGRKVQRVTEPRLATMVPYFTKEVFTADNGGVLVSVQGEDHKWRPFIVEPERGRMRCVCDEPMLSPHGPAIGGERVVYITEDRRLGWAPVEGGAFHGVSMLEGTFQLSEVAASSCGRYAVFCYNETPTPVVRSLIDQKFHSPGSERAWMGLRGVMVRVDLETGLSKAVAGGAGGVGHPLISAVDPCVMEYCSPAHAWQQTQRMWSVRWLPQGNYSQVQPLFVQKIGYDAVGHEFMLADGQVAAVWMHIDRIEHGWNEAQRSYILVADPVSGKHRAYETPGLVWNHLHGRDGRRFISEGRSDLHAPTQRQRKEAAVLRDHARMDLLCLYEVRGRKTQATPLCRTGCSWQGQKGHPHAVLDRASRMAYFNSDGAGPGAVYRVEL